MDNDSIMIHPNVVGQIVLQFGAIKANGRSLSEPEFIMYQQAMRLVELQCRLRADAIEEFLNGNDKDKGDNTSETPVTA